MRTILLISLLAVCLTQLPTCPNGNLASDIYSAKITLGLAQTNPTIVLASDDLYTYTYVLPLPFRRAPSVALAVSDIQSAYSQSFSHFVKYLSNKNKQNLTFVIKIDNKLSNWIKFSFNFLAETRDDILAFSYDLAPNYLVVDGQSKNETWIVPYLESWTNITDYRMAVYLNGFELYSKASNAPSNQFEIRIIGSKLTQNGIILTVKTNSTVQVQRIYFSFVVFKERGNYLVTPFLNMTAFPGEARYVVSNTGIQLKQTSPTTIIPVDMSSYWPLYGISSFTMENNPVLPRKYSFDINLASGEAVSNTTDSNFTFLQNNCMLLKSDDCSGCLGYRLFDVSKNTCVAQCPTDSYPELGRCKTCPAGSHLSGTNCITCSTNEEWNGTNCVCIPGFYRNSQSVCDLCPAGTTLMDGKCQCPYAGQTFDEIAKLCSCPPQMYVINGKCQQCESGKFWDGKTCVDVCSPYVNMRWDGSNCMCRENYTIVSPNICQCINGTVDLSGNCTLCNGINTMWTGTDCACKTGYKMNLSTGQCIADTPIVPPIIPPMNPYYPPYYPMPNGWTGLVTIQGAIMASVTTLSISLRMKNLPASFVQNGICTQCSNLLIAQTTLPSGFKTTIQYNGISSIDNLVSLTMNLQFDIFPTQSFGLVVKINPAYLTQFTNGDPTQPAYKYIDLRTLSTSDSNIRKDSLR